jgi:hypothetical protein
LTAGTACTRWSSAANVDVLPLATEQLALEAFFVLGEPGAVVVLGEVGEKGQGVGGESCERHGRSLSL